MRKHHPAFSPDGDRCALSALLCDRCCRWPPWLSRRRRRCRRPGPARPEPGRSAGPCRPCRRHHRRGLLPQPGRHAMEPRQRQLSGQQRQCVLDRTRGQSATGDLRQPHRPGRRHRVRRLLRSTPTACRASRCRARSISICATWRRTSMVGADPARPGPPGRRGPLRRSSSAPPTSRPWSPSSRDRRRSRARRVAAGRRRPDRHHHRHRHFRGQRRTGAARRVPDRRS